ncbi:MAG: hypothetical protein ACKVTZ_18725 [Bacteroidia bacterium]
MTYYSTLKCCFLFLLLSIAAFFPSFAQVFGSKTDSTDRVWHISAGLDFVTNTFQARLRDNYSGEYYERNYVTNEAKWIWKEYDNLNKNPLRKYKISNIRYNLWLNMYKNLYVGLAYNLSTVQGSETITYVDPSTGQVIQIPNYSFNSLTAIAGTIAYEQRFKIANFNRFSVCPSISYGGYSASLLDLSNNSNYFEGVGRERYFDARLALQLHVWAGWKLRAFANYGTYFYKENYPSVVFPDKNRIVNYSISATSFGFGVSRTLDIYEDNSERKLSKREIKKLEKLEERKEKKQEKKEKSE